MKRDMKNLNDALTRDGIRQSLYISRRSCHPSNTAELTVVKLSALEMIKTDSNLR